MKNIKALLKLEYSYVKTYWIYVLLFFGIALIMGIANQDGASFILSLMIFVVALMTFPFEFTDKSNLNILYGTLPTNRKSIVTARYVFFIILVLVSSVIGILGGIIIDAIFTSINMRILLSFLAISVGAALLLAGWIAPFLFKFGWQKGRVFFWIAIAVVVILINIGPLISIFGVENSFSIFIFVLRNLTVSSFVSLGAGIVVFAISFLFSQKVYLNKDF